MSKRTKTSKTTGIRNKNSLEQRLKVLIENGHEVSTDWSPTPPRIGRPPKTDIERLQVWVWYWKVRSLCPDWNDTRLDEEFGQHAGVTRLRIFDRIRRKGWFPHTEETQDHNQVPQKKRKMLRSPTLVANIDENPKFRGTASILNSEFWEVFGKQNGNIRAVRKTLNNFLNKNGLIRLEGDLSGIIDKQIKEAFWQPERKISYISWGGIYTHWLHAALNELPDEFAKLTLIGLLLREALLLSSLRHIHILERALHDKIWHISKEAWLAPIRDDFVRIIEEYIVRGHIDLRDLEALYTEETHHSISGYIVRKDRVDFDLPEDQEEKNKWAKKFELTCKLASVSGPEVDGPWNPNDDKYHEEAYQVWLLDHEDPNFEWPECPDDGGTFVTNPEDWPPDLL